MQHQLQHKFTVKSSNTKTGPIPVTMSTKATCPVACPLKTSGCYAEYGHVNIHWQRISEGKQAISWAQMLLHIKALPEGQLWRHNVAGDLPHQNEMIDSPRLAGLIAANRGKAGFTYTHHLVEGSSTTAEHNRQLIQHANSQGFTINLSANSAEHADELTALDCGPVVCLIPEDAPRVTYTPKGLQVTTCPATYRDDIDCSRCKICAVSSRRSIVGFPLHGVQKKRARVVMLKREPTKGRE